ncbi:hypothetical protein [Streptomyces canus]|uniref:hypothetical protein n=1 Tax=Streptomyces canus TaxID=58343 RepID=UPI00277E3413|nr:hypothetical protein [Streptomyces canus]MDQ1073357.1 hypothetical protein [Streptomyces canus]
MTGPCVASGRPAGNSSAPTAATTAAMTAQAVKALPKPPVPAAVPRRRAAQPPSRPAPAMAEITVTPSAALVRRPSVRQV